MQTILDDFTPKDFIAILMVTGLILFKMTGHNGSFDLPVIGILGYYFARREDKPVMVEKDQLPLK